KADVTKGSGDAGIDIILEKDGEKYCVQCKAHKKPVGPAIVRELYGAMHSAGIRQGILVCLGGFTSGVYDFVKDKPIKLVDIDDVIKMVNE
ncbi:MAG: restriction endonuclease, partial [Candidatus Gastranaerophilales bacterium]|nr:restriction endonuclease [Candidatus Gastranaerophilales bacterium]